MPVRPGRPKLAAIAPLRAPHGQVPPRRAAAVRVDLSPRLRPGGRRHAAGRGGLPGAPTWPRRSSSRAAPHVSEAVLAVFPELGLSAYSNEDLFQQDALLDASLDALQALVDASRDLPLALAVGLPLRADDRLFNCAVLVHRGRLLGVVPKTYLPNYREFYERRQFAPGAQALSTSLRLLGQDVPFGTRPAVRGARPAGLRAAPRDLRGPLGAAAAEHARRARRRHGARQPLRQRRHRRQGRLPAAARRLAVGALHRRLPVLRRGPRRVHHRPRLGRPRADLRERRAARRIGALPRRARPRHRRPRPRPPAPGTRAHDELRRQRAGARSASCASSGASSSTSACRRAACRCGGASSASRTCPPTPRAATSAAPRCTTSRSQGLMKRLAATGHQEGRDRHLGRARLDAGGTGRGARLRSARPAAHATSSATRCPASAPASTPSTARTR